MKKLFAVGILTFMVASVTIIPTTEINAQSNIKCWWNPVDEDCCENGSVACAGGCDGGVVQ
ncbi:MAG TPA: hypothetical protein PLM56_10325 [Cyclobacteriaceae bacterium]|jgi:phage-related tail fiber protein|nr:hypothetical protein [Cyclobacteriaceae bacterium]